MNRIDLPEVTALLKAFLAAELSREELQAGLAERVMSPPLKRPAEDWRASSESEILASYLAERICGTERKAEDFESLIGRLVRCVESVGDPDESLDLVPLILHHDEFSIILSKHFRGLIAEAGLRSVIRRRFAFDGPRAWLEHASVEQLQEVADMIESNDYIRLNRFIRA